MSTAHILLLLSGVCTVLCGSSASVVAAVSAIGAITGRSYLPPSPPFLTSPRAAPAPALILCDDIGESTNFVNKSSLNLVNSSVLKLEISYTTNINNLSISFTIYPLRKLASGNCLA